MMTEGEPSAPEADAVSVETDTKDLRYRYERWSHAVHHYVYVDLFRYVQFINRGVGPPLGELICDMDVWPSPVILV
jgi:hypothetical protein